MKVYRQSNWSDPEEMHDQFNKNREENIATAELDFGSLLPLPLGYNLWQGNLNYLK